MYIKNALTLYELRHSKYSCKKNKFNKSKLSLIGTVQPFATNVASCGWNIVSFQSLIDTVQQQCLLSFMFSLYLISAVFQSF